MQVNSVGQMYGGYGQQQGGMRDIIQSLSYDQRVALRQEMQDIPQENRKDVISQMKQLDNTQENYFDSLLEILNQNKSFENKDDSNLLSIYA